MVLEVGVAIGLVLLAINMSLLYIGIGVAVIALIIAVLRWRGKWFTQWVGLILRYSFRGHDRTTTPPGPAGEPATGDKEAVTGPEDPRVNLLRLVVPDLVVAHGSDHERKPVGLAWHEGTWTAVLLVEPAPALISQASGAPSLPLSALGSCLEDRGVVLDSIQMIWHTYPGSAALPPESPALSSYLEVLGPLPAAARRTTWIAVRLDPRRCPAAIRERGGGVVGAHRALIGALSRVRNALESRGVPTRPLGPEEVLRAGISAAELTAVAGNPARVGMKEKWTGVTGAGVEHASYAVTSWPKGEITANLNTLTSIRTLSATIAMSISPAEDEGQVGLRGVVRLSARTERELDAADDQLKTLADRAGVSLTPLRGLQVEGLAATMPMGGTA